MHAGLPRRTRHPGPGQCWGPSRLPHLCFTFPYLCGAPQLQDPARPDAFQGGGFRPDCRLPFLPREHPPTTRIIQQHSGQGSALGHILLRPQNRAHTLKDPQPKALAVVPFTHSARQGDLSPPGFPAVVRVLVHTHPVHIDPLLAAPSAAPRGFCPDQRPQPPRGRASPLPVP